MITCRRAVGDFCREVRESTHLKDRHTKGIYVCAPGRELSPWLVGEPELLGVHHLRCHPPKRTPHSAVVRTTPSGRFIDHRG